MARILIFLVAYFGVIPSTVAQRFHSDDPIAHDNDGAVEVSSIAKHKLNDQYDFFLHTFGKPGERTKRPARNINTLGEAPDSSWFQNRHGMFPMSLNGLVRGPNTGDGPSMEQPWQVIEAKTEGITPGFRIRDARGDVYVIKFDPPHNPELATAAEVISTRFFHAIGFNVPENHLAFFKRDQLRGVPEMDLDKMLKRVHRTTDGTYRAVASKLLKGNPIGPFQYFGTRPDDPNDIFRHEDRRELRGLSVFSAWLNHDDSRAINSLDMVVGEQGNRHVKHYLIDFGSTLGSGSVGPQKHRAGWEYMWEPRAVLGRIATLGLWDRSWVRAKYPAYRSIGRFESTYFRPEEWKPEYPNSAFLNTTDQDGYWAAKIVMSFTAGEIAAVVREGKLGDPEAEDYLVRTLIERRDKIGAYWLTRLSSFDRFALTPDGGIEFEHLASEYDFARRPEHRLQWFSFDNMTGERRRIDGSRPKDQQGYFLALISSDEGTVEVYVRVLGGNAQIIGIER